MVPALDIGLEKPITQAGTILVYIAEIYSGKRLGPAPGALSQLKFNEIMSFLTGDFHPAFGPVFVPQRYAILNAKNSVNKIKLAAYERIDRVLEHLDILIGNDDFL